ncbi:MAG: tetratricopeptide repeat protein [Paludibacter sp.]
MKTFGRFWIYSLICISLIGCSLMPDELKTAEKLIEVAPDSAFRILKHLSPEKYKSASNRALYGLLMIRTLDKKYLPLKPDSLLDFSMNYYEKHPDGDRLASCYFYKGRSYKYDFKYEKAMNLYLKALDEAQKDKNNILLGRIYFDLGDIYIIQQDYFSARQKYKISYNYFKQTKFQPLAFYSLLNIGRTYYVAKDYKNAQLFYRKIAVLTKDSIQQGDLYQEMGLNFYDYKKTDSALLYLRKTIHYPYIMNNRAIRYYFMARLFFDLNQNDSALIYASNSFKYKPDIRTQRECYRIMTNCEFINKHLDKVTLYMNKYVALGDSIRKIDGQTKGRYIETMHSNTQEVVKTKNTLKYLFVFLLLVIIASVLIYTLKQHRNRTEKRIIEENHFRQKVSIRNEVLLKLRETLFQKIAERKSEQSLEQKNATSDERELLIKKMYEELLHLNDLDLFFREMDSVLNNLVTKLRKRYKGLTTKELIWCCLHLLDISNRDILIILDYKVGSLGKMKTRLTRKTNLQTASELDELLNSILIKD